MSCTRHDDNDVSCYKACQEAVIVGGGIAGLAVAAALQNIATIKNLCILEQSSSFYDESQGAALILGPNGLKALRAIGKCSCVLNRVLEQGSQIKGNVIWQHQQEQQQVIPDTTLETTSLPQVLIRWSVLRRILQDLLSLNSSTCECGNDATKVKVCTNVEATDYQVLDNERIQVLQSDGTVIQLSNDNDNSTSLLIAADGIHSNFSKRIHPQTKNNIKDNGRVNIKAVVKKQLPIDNTKGITYSYFQGNIACFAGPAGNDYTYWAISLQSDDDDDDDHSNDDDLHQVKKDLLQTLSTIDAPSFLVELIQATAPRTIYVRQSQESIHIEQLYSDTENVVLVGDAAHAMSPSYGQCGSMALEDAVTLASCIHSKKSGELQEALSNYSQARTSRSEEMVKRSAERTKMAVRGQAAEDVSQWIFQWEPPSTCK